MAFNPFNPDGTWNYKAAENATEAELTKAWADFKKANNLSDATEPDPASWNFSNKSSRSWQSAGRSHRSGNTKDYDPWSRKSQNPYLRFSTPQEEKAFHEWVEIESNDEPVEAIERWYDRWHSVGFKVYQKWYRTPLWEMKTSDRNEYLEWRKTVKQVSYGLDDKELLNAWKIHKAREKQQKSTYEWFTDQEKDYNFQSTWQEAFKNAFKDRTDFRGFQSGQGRSKSHKRQLFEQIFNQQPDMILSAFGEHERMRRRKDENQYKSDNPVGTIKIVSTRTLYQVIMFKLEKELQAGKGTQEECEKMLDQLSGGTYNTLTPLGEQVAKILLNPLSNFNYAE